MMTRLISLKFEKDFRNYFVIMSALLLSACNTDVLINNEGTPTIDVITPVIEKLSTLVPPVITNSTSNPDSVDKGKLEEFIPVRFDVEEATYSIFNPDVIVPKDVLREIGYSGGAGGGEGLVCDDPDVPSIMSGSYYFKTKLEWQEST